MTKKYQEQYCKKHNQHYASYLSHCPICTGEELDGYMRNKLTFNDKGEAQWEKIKECKDANS